MNIALTGGIGCGKSAALNIFCQMGYLITSADAINNDLLSQAETITFISSIFGSQYLKNGAIDKAQLAELIFSVPAKRKILEDFLHPRIAAVQTDTMKRSRELGKHCICEIPLLFEKNLESQFDTTICLACSRQTQLERLEKRGLPRERALARIASQLPLEEKMKRAQFVIFNDGNLEFLTTQIKLFLKNINI